MNKVLKRSTFLTLAILAVTSLVLADQTATTQGYSLGSKVSNFTLTSVDGKQVSLDSYKGKKVIVLDFWSCQCPVSARYEDYMKKLSTDYAAKDVVFLALDANKTESTDWITKVAKERDVNFPILLDKGSVLADKFNAQHTPEMFVLDKKGVVQYHGAPDNNKPSTDANYKDYARAAIDSLLAGKAVSTQETKAFGCSIKR